MGQTRTWLTTPVGSAPADELAEHEHWVAGPRVPTEPRPPSRFRGALALLVALLVVVGLTFALTPVLLDTQQDPTFGGRATSDG